MKHLSFGLIATVATAPLVSEVVIAKDYLTIEQAQSILFPSSHQFVTAPLTVSKEMRKAIKKQSGSRQRWDEQKIWRVEKDGALAGWFMVDDVVGKHEFITYALAIDPAGRVLGVEVLSYRETHGGEVRGLEWRSKFIGKTEDHAFKLNDDIPNIAGATLSCRNMTDGVHRLLAIHKLYLADG